MERVIDILIATKLVVEEVREDDKKEIQKTRGVISEVEKPGGGNEG
jgi:hypothetical protein